MTIQITRPEIEALIEERMKNGEFTNVEDFLLQALKSWPPAANPPEGTRPHSGEDLVEAMQASPYKDIELEPLRTRMPARDVSF